VGPEQLVEEVGDLTVVEHDDARHVPDGPQYTNHRLNKVNTFLSINIYLFLDEI
jgi:hypothetical protein